MYHHVHHNLIFYLWVGDRVQHLVLSLIAPHLIFWDMVFHWTCASLIQLVSPVSSRFLFVCLLRVGITDLCLLYVSVDSLNSCPCACLASALPTEPASQPRLTFSFFFVFFWKKKYHFFSPNFKRGPGTLVRLLTIACNLKSSMHAHTHTQHTTHNTPPPPSS